MTKTQQKFIPAAVLASLNSLQVNPDAVTFNINVKKNRVAISLVYRIEAPSEAASGNARQGEGIRESATRSPNQTPTGIPAPATTQVYTEPASVALKETVGKKITKSTKRHNIRRAKARREKKKQVSEAQVENIAMDTTVIVPFQEFPPIISPLPSTPEPIQQDSTVQDNRSFSGPPQATVQATVVKELDDSRNIPESIRDEQYEGPEYFLMRQEGIRNSTSTMRLKVRLFKQDGPVTYLIARRKDEHFGMQNMKLEHFDGEDVYLITEKQRTYDKAKEKFHNSRATVADVDNMDLYQCLMKQAVMHDAGPQYLIKK